MKIIVSQVRGGSYEAQLENRSEIKGYGQTPFEAVGNLVCSYQEIFNFKVEHAEIKLDEL